ncbi:MAG: ABC transporter permease subunit [Spirochaetaceae bacterium]|jgi:putative aldouronate transport system permease protein|nr:ABC transporter permease subunit [Spirochaetaceae bacterium]
MIQNDSGLLSQKSRGWGRYFWMNRYLYFLLLPCLVYFIIFHYVPMYGLILAFKDFKFSKGIVGSPWVGLENFRYLFSLDTFYRVMGNSLFLSILRLFIFFPIPIILTLLMNEIPLLTFKRIAQTLLYLPYFISWVVIGGILVNLLSPSWGIVNNFIKALGGEPVFFLGSAQYFRGIAVISHIWKNAGWDTIIYLAAVTSIDPELYQAATIDGASRLQRIWYITLPGIQGTIIILLLLSIGNLMNNGFEQIFILQNGSNLAVSEVFETYTYRLGIINGRFSFATTVGLFGSVVGFVLLMSANAAAKLFGKEGIF